MRKFFYTLTLLGLVFQTLLAQVNEKPKVAFCETGKGCIFYDHPFSYKQLDVMFNYMGVFREKKGILTFLVNNQGERINYPDTKRNSKELHEYFGGKGEPPIKPWTMTMFQSIQPEDGNWIVKNERPQTSKCPKGVSEQLDKLQLIKSGNKTFGKPFSPVELLPAKEAHWFTVGPDLYKGLIMVSNSDSITTVYDVKVNTPKSIDGTMNYTIKIPGLAACRIKIDFKYTKN